MTKVFHENCKSLNCLQPTREPKATEHIKEMIEMTTSLIIRNLHTFQKGMYILLLQVLKNMENYLTKT